ncbi:ArsC family reductase [Roseateles depolymerans]|uniref:Trimethylamine-N-oxide reductase 2 n=1 Tax=Roseateles depolymerans TaxID=76731 RepID=A0A0U3LH31_9BURK|nr:ArsC family reductase [Roseateles depolymerans]ALV07407.1 Trimethylamine-N-oxide reductase 2 [Roseateles depolymerans]REG22379.1 Spx/MgsR family transcriptional regulator [Roseateles depolymerans]
MIIVYGIPNCDTVKKARTWLDDQGLAYQFHDYKKQGVPADKLPHWLQTLGWEKVLNRAGTTWRKLDDATKAGVTDAASAAALMQAQPSVIKRPLVEWADGRLSVGFSAELFASHR